MSGDAELIDKVKSINNDFFTMLEEMRKETNYLKYRKFVHRYIPDPESSRMLLGLIRDAEAASIPLHSDNEFWTFFNTVADEEFVRLKGAFTDERIQVGWRG